MCLAIPGKIVKIEGHTAEAIDQWKEIADDQNLDLSDLL